MKKYTFEQLKEMTQIISESSSWVMNNNQPDEYTISQFKYLQIKVVTEDGRDMYYTLNLNRLNSLGISTQCSLGYIRTEEESTQRSKLYDSEQKFYNALKRISKMNIVSVRTS